MGIPFKRSIRWLQWRAETRGCLVQSPMKCLNWTPPSPSSATTIVVFQYYCLKKKLDTHLYVKIRWIPGSIIPYPHLTPLFYKLATGRVSHLNGQMTNEKVVVKYYICSVLLYDEEI